MLVLHIAMSLKSNQVYQKCNKLARNKYVLHTLNELKLNWNWIEIETKNSHTISFCISVFKFQIQLKLGVDFIIFRIRLRKWIIDKWASSSNNSTKNCWSSCDCYSPIVSKCIPLRIGRYSSNISKHYSLCLNLSLYWLILMTQHWKWC